MTTQHMRQIRSIAATFPATFPATIQCTVTIRSLLLGAVSLLTLVGCKDLAGTQQLPAGTQNPAFYQTRAGALGMRNAAVYQMEQMIPALVANSGLLTDELMSNQVGILQSSVFPDAGSLDERILPDVLALGQGGLFRINQTYSGLTNGRGSIMQAIGALAAYDTAADSPLLRSELYALEGYTEILLADFFCSGVPLSTLDFQLDYTYHPSSTTEEVYQDALAKLDTALLLSPGNARFQNLAAVLKGRALLNLGQYAQAAQAVAAVPDGFQYQLAVVFEENTGTQSVNIILDSATVSDREGFNGLPFVSSNDPRTAVVVEGTTLGGQQLLFPSKYALTGFTPFTVADWIEARLIQAEAALQVHDTTTWLTTLNHLRETARAPGQTTALADTTDPGTSPNDSARVSLLFQERAYWFFMTGHRQGDLRRLIRQYGRPEDRVYPKGSYLPPGAGQYGNDVTAPIPQSEYINPLFHGCLNRGA